MLEIQDPVRAIAAVAVRPEHQRLARSAHTADFYQESKGERAQHESQMQTYLKESPAVQHQARVAA